VNGFASFPTAFGRASFGIAALSDDRVGLTTDRGVQKKIIKEGSGHIYPVETVMTTAYTETLASADWSVDDVISWGKAYKWSGINRFIFPSGRTHPYAY
jgi:hypothetical protein